MSKGTSEDPLSTARAIFGWGMLSVVFWACIFMLVSCTPSPETVNPTPVVDVKPVIRYVNVAQGYSTQAKNELAKARATAAEAQREAQAANALVEEMTNNHSPYADQVGLLRKGYEDKITKLQEQISETDIILDRLWQTLDDTQNQLEIAKAASQANEDEKNALRAQVVEFKEKAEKYRLKYEALKKYRFAIIGMGAWLLIKLIGSLGAWSPAGRVSRFLVG